MNDSVGWSEVKHVVCGAEWCRELGSIEGSHRGPIIVDFHVVYCAMLNRRVHAGGRVPKATSMRRAQSG